MGEATMHEEDMLQKLIDKLSALYDATRYKEVIPVAYEYLEHDSTNLYALYVLSYSLIYVGQLDEAEDTIKQIFAHYPDYPDGLELSGLLCGWKGQHDEAGAYFEQCIAKKPENASYRINFAQSLYNGISWNRFMVRTFGLRLRTSHLARVQRAIDQLHEANRLKPDYRHMLLLGKCYDTLFRLDEAFVYLKEGLILNPADSDIHALLARYLLIQGDIRSAESHCTQALEINPESIVGLQVRKDIDQFTSNKRELQSYSSDYLKTYCSVYPKNADNWLKLIRLKEEFGINPLAEYKAYVKLKPEDWEMQFAYGKTLHDYKWYLSARGVFRKLDKLNPGNRYTQAWLNTLSKVSKGNMYLLSPIRRAGHSIKRLLGNSLLQIIIFPIAAVTDIVNTLHIRFHRG